MVIDVKLPKVSLVEVPIVNKFEDAFPRRVAWVFFIEGD